MNWYIQSGRDSDVVISTRMRFARNLRNFKFNIQDENEEKMLEEEIKAKLPELGYRIKFYSLKDMDEITRLSLVEKNLISPESTINKKTLSSILLNDDENICIMLNEEDHIRMQVFSAGFEIENTFNLARELDEKIDKIYDIAKSRKYGYLTSCPTNIGTGIRASVMLHLPGLTKTGNIKKVLEVITSFGLEVRGIYGENSKSTGDMYQISNKQTLGITEQDIIKNLRVITEKIIEQEREARKILAKDRVTMEDMVYRSYGLISNCRKISSEESRKLLSNIKLGVDMGILTEVNDLKVLKMYLYTKSANLQKYIGEKLDVFDRDVQRAEIIKNIIKE